MPPKPGLLYGAGAPPLLKASTSTLAPLTAGMPKLSAAWPERKLTMPILNVSCACAAPAHHAAAAPASARRKGCQDRLREVCRVMPCLLWVVPRRTFAAAAVERRRHLLPARAGVERSLTRRADRMRRPARRSGGERSRPAAPLPCALAGAALARPACGVPRRLALAGRGKAGRRRDASPHAAFHRCAAARSPTHADHGALRGSRRQDRLAAG